ncbi:precorrin-6A synthase (deacetylating) [Thioclava sp. FR2]|uniref:precorrin-6A synthase (deacetylating) n=1 Tax=Thioclava sp. FR2 TaxID=3445780 RepID=UPI003EBCCD90
MITLHLIGIGTGSPDHVTRQAQKAINACDLILIPMKGEDKADLAGLRRAILASCLENPKTRVVEFDLPVRDPATPGYLDRVNNWHDAIAEKWEGSMRDHLGDEATGTVGLLVWGDPSLYDSTLRIAERVKARFPITVQVTPGVTAVQALCAAHAIALNDLGAPFFVTTGRRLRDEGWPSGADTVVVMLDAGGSFAKIDQQGVSIWWGAFVGMEEQILVSGKLSDVSDQILKTRQSAREAHGWIMDIYLMRRTQP